MMGAFLRVLPIEAFAFDDGRLKTASDTHKASEYARSLARLEDMHSSELVKPPSRGPLIPLEM